MPKENIWIGPSQQTKNFRATSELQQESYGEKPKQEPEMKGLKLNPVLVQLSYDEMNEGTAWQSL